MGKCRPSCRSQRICYKQINKQVEVCFVQTDWQIWAHYYLLIINILWYILSSSMWSKLTLLLLLFFATFLARARTWIDRGLSLSPQIFHSWQSDYTKITAMISLHLTSSIDKPWYQKISSLAKVMGLQSRILKNPVSFNHHVEHGSRHRKDIRHDRSDNINHCCYFWKSIAHVVKRSCFFADYPYIRLH